MKQLILFLLFISTNSSIFASVNICFEIRYTTDNGSTMPLPNASIESVPYPTFTNAMGQARFFGADESILTSEVNIVHPLYTFPSFPLKDFPYRLKGDFLVFTITGTKTALSPVNEMTFYVPTKKTANTHVFMRCLPQNRKDSLVLLDSSGDYLASFEKNDLLEGQIIDEIPLKKVQDGGAIFNPNSGDTTFFGPNDWMQVIPFQKFEPVVRAASEFESILTLQRQMDEMQIRHYENINQLEQQVEHLEDSIEQILNPKEKEPIPEPYPEPPQEAEEIIAFPVTIARNPFTDEELETKILAILQRENIRKTGEIVIELSIWKDGDVNAFVIATSPEHRIASNAISELLESVKWRPCLVGGKSFESTQILQIKLNAE